MWFCHFLTIMTPWITNFLLPRVSSTFNLFSKGNKNLVLQFWLRFHKVQWPLVQDCNVYIHVISNSILQSLSPKIFQIFSSYFEFYQCIRLNWQLLFHWQCKYDYEIPQLLQVEWYTSIWVCWNLLLLEQLRLLIPWNQNSN